MKCPVCKTESINSHKCLICGFDQLDKEFLNKEDAKQWKKEILLPFIQKHVCDVDDYSIEDGVLEEFYGEKPIVVLPTNVRKIEDNAFLECNQITCVVLPSELNEFGFGVFSDCESLVKINIPEGITELPEQTFAGCKALRNIILPKNLETIVSHAFSECESLTELVIPHSVKFIDYYAFFNCIALDKLVIPKTVETIKSNAFEGCGNLTIYCEHLSKPDDWDEDWCENGDLVMKGMTPYNAPKTVYWGNEWHYENSNPVPNEKRR